MSYIEIEMPRIIDSSFVYFETLFNNIKSSFVYLWMMGIILVAITYLILHIKYNSDDLCFAVLISLTILFLCSVSHLFLKPIKSCTMNVKETIYPCDINQNCSVFEMAININEINSSEINSSEINSSSSTPRTIVEFHNCERDIMCSQYIRKLNTQFYCLEINRVENNKHAYPPFKITPTNKPTFNFIRGNTEVYNNELGCDIFLIIILSSTWSFIIKFVFKINVNAVHVARRENARREVRHDEDHDNKIQLKKMPECVSKNIEEEDRECPICRCVIPIEEVYTPLQCFCRYHKECLSEYTKAECPTCQK
jgi:hypothetical protein